jgi:hypothetical protein
MGVSIYKVPRRLYWTADRSRLVEHGDMEAAFLAYPAGEEISMEEARRFGFLDTLDTPVTPEKAVDAAENKMRAARPADKAAGKVAAAKETT